MSDNSPRTTLDQLISDAVENVKQDAVKQVFKELDISRDGEVSGVIRRHVLAMLDKDPEIKAKLRDALIRALDNPLDRRRSAW